MKISIVIPVHNQWELLNNCVNSVIENTISTEFQIVIINDGSDKKTTNFCKKLFDEKKIQNLIHHIDAKGFSESCNQGILASQDYDYICLLNSDTKIVTNDWLAKIVACGQSNKKIGCIGVLSNCATSQTVGKNFVKESEMQKYGDWITSLSEKRYPKTNFINGFCYFMKTRVQKQTGLLDIDVFPHYGSEDDFSMRVQKNGFELVIADDVYVYHYSNQSYKDRRMTIIANSFPTLTEKWGSLRIKQLSIFSDNVLNYLREKMNKENNPESKISNVEKTIDLTEIKKEEESNKFTQNQIEIESCDIIIPTYNALDYLKRCIDSIKKFTKINYKIIVIDNNSNYETKEYIKTLNTITIFNNKNYGFSFAVNQGLELSESKYVCILNSDTIVTESWLSNLIFLLEREHAGIIGPVTNYAYSNLQQINVSYTEPEINLIQKFAKERIKEKGLTCFETNKLVGFCLVSRNDLLKQVGHFDERFEIGCFEDDDICLRFIERGHKAICAQGIFIHHFGGESFNSFKEKSNDALEKNKLLYVDKWYTNKRIEKLHSLRLPLKIIYLLASDGPSGGVKIVFEQANRLRARGHDVKIICSTREAKQKWFDLKVPIIYDNLKNTPYCDILIGTYFTTLSYLQQLDAKIKIHLCQGYEALLYTDEKILNTIKNGYATTKNKIVVSKWLKDLLTKEFDFESTYISNGIDLYVFSFKQHAKNKIPRILIVGTEQLKIKGVETAINVVKKLTRKFELVRLSTSNQYDKTKCEYHDMTKMTQDEIAAVYSSCDVTICASRKVEGFSLPPLESMASGTPVITTDSGGVTDYAINNENAIISAIDAMKHNIELLLDNQEFYNKLADNGIVTARKYLWHDQIDKLEQHFYNLHEDYFKNKREQLSVCMIVKNEEKWIEQCLESIKEIATEIVIIDTGSTDNTVQLAKKYGAIIYHYTWPNDFSKARNFALEKVKQPWVLILDADEKIAKKDLDKIRKAIKDVDFAYNFITRNYVNDPNVENVIVNDIEYKEESLNSYGWGKSQKVRLFPTNKNIKFEGKVHELVENSIKRTSLKIKDINVPIHHYSFLKRDIEKEKKYLVLGKEKLEQSNDIVSIVELATQYMALNNFDEALILWRKAIQIDSKNANYLAKIGTTYNLLENFQEAEKHFLKSIAIEETEYACKHLGICYARQNNYQKAYENFKKIVSCTSDLKTMADFAHCCNILGKFDEAITILEKCAQINREKTISWGLLDHAYNEKGIELAKKGKFQLAYNMINEAIKINPNFKNAILNLQEIKKVLHYQRQKLV